MSDPGVEMKQGARQRPLIAAGLFLFHCEKPTGHLVRRLKRLPKNDPGNPPREGDLNIDWQDEIENSLHYKPKRHKKKRRMQLLAEQHVTFFSA